MFEWLGWDEPSKGPRIHFLSNPSFEEWGSPFGPDPNFLCCTPCLTKSPQPNNPEIFGPECPKSCQNILFPTPPPPTPRVGSTDVTGNKLSLYGFRTSESFMTTFSICPTFAFQRLATGPLCRRHLFGNDRPSTLQREGHCPSTTLQGTAFSGASKGQRPREASYAPA